MLSGDQSLLNDYCLQLGSLLDRRQTERALMGARLHAERAQRLAEDALCQAQAADRAKTSFLANVTHELRTPLNAIIGFSEIIETGTAAADHPAYGRYIRDAGTRLLGIVNDVLTLARFEAGKLELDEQVVSLDEVLSASIKAMATEAAHKRVVIRSEVAADQLVHVDPSKIKQALIHLLSNAVKFNSEDGSVRITVQLLPGGDLVISIHDTGCGIPAEHLDHVLEPFGQVEETLSRENEGVGLGLPLARSLTRLHAGDLTINSEIGVGTVVDVRLPATRVRNAPMG